MLTGMLCTTDIVTYRAVYEQYAGKAQKESMSPTAYIQSIQIIQSVQLQH